MNAERIERLAMDRALGELNEDATVLFETYLAEHPEAQPWAQDMASTCAQTREAVDKKTHGQSTEDFPARMHWRWLTQIQWERVGRWAALVAVAAGIGVTVGRWSARHEPPADVMLVRAEPAGDSEGWQQVVNRQSQGFWQSKALALLQTKPYETPGSRERQMNFWLRYKQSRKERSYE